MEWLLAEIISEASHRHEPRYPYHLAFAPRRRVRYANATYRKANTYSKRCSVHNNTTKIQ